METMLCKNRNWVIWLRLKVLNQSKCLTQVIIVLLCKDMLVKVKTTQTICFNCKVNQDIITQMVLLKIKI